MSTKAVLLCTGICWPITAAIKFPRRTAQDDARPRSLKKDFQVASQQVFARQWPRARSQVGDGALVDVNIADVEKTRHADRQQLVRGVGMRHCDKRVLQLRIHCSHCCDAQRVCN